VNCKSVTSSHSLTETVKRREKCSVGILKHQGAVVQIVCTFILLVVSYNWPLQGDEQDCRLYTVCHSGAQVNVVSLMRVRNFYLPCDDSHETNV
jgi:hypothetical protein